ncbi:hypothetical protein N7475_006419 [Penicillium sp. IBT 31633x]|nr:hypothetical protein N7475_006419 [Penicillium sp. IBT 31633x]
MLGLGEYESSSEDEVEHKGPSPDSQRKTDRPPSTSQADQNEALKPVEQPLNKTSSNAATDLVPNGPVLGPASMDMAPLSEDKHSSSGRSSPFSASRALIQDLTLPPVPNLDIPPSPPGSPNPAANAKFEHFLSLKKQGVHFNSKLASSSSLKNPSLLVKMMEHAGIEEEAQYDTSLPADLWTTSDLPKWGFKEELLRTQQILRKQSEEKKASGQRTSVGFVPESA